MTSENYLIFVLPLEFDERDMEYSDAISWAYSNTENENVISLAIEDVYLLDQKVLDLINDVNDSMIGPYEDGWVNSQEVKKIISFRLKKYTIEIKEVREKFLVSRIIQLLQKAVETNHNIYFKF